MPVENQNNKLKQKLDALTEVPEAYQFNSSAVWMKLEAQLQSNNKTKKRSVFLYAAASVLVMILSLMVYRNFSRHEFLAPVVTYKNIELKKSPPLPELKNKSLAPVLKFVENKQQAKAKPEQQFIHAAAPVRHIIAPELITLPVENTFQNESIVLKQKDEEIQIAAVPAIPKMRFKIAHINEVNRNPVADDIAKQAEKINYGLSLRKEFYLSSTDEKEQTPAYSLRKPKSFFSLITSQ